MAGQRPSPGLSAALADVQPTEKGEREREKPRKDVSGPDGACRARAPEPPAVIWARLLG